MKKYVLSAVVTSLFIPMAYAMDGAAPAVEVEVPVVEVEISGAETLPGGESPPVDEAVIDPIVVESIEVEAVDVRQDVFVGLRTLEVEVEVDVELKPEVCPGIDEAVLVGPPIDENGEPIAVCWTFGAPIDDDQIVINRGPAVGVEGDVETTLTEAELFDLASQSGVAVDDNGEPGTTEVKPEDCEFSHFITVDGPVDCPVGGVDENGHQLWIVSSGVEPVDDNGEPVVFQTFGNVDGGGEVEATSLDDAPIRSHGEIQPNFRGGITDRGAEALAASASAVVSTDDSDAPNAQMLNDEQRGAVRGLRSDEESAKPRAGLGKLMAKFRKPKSEVTMASGTADLALSSKLAEVDRMRDTALRTGDQKALAKADKLEKELRAKSGKVTKIPTRTK